MNRRSFLRAGGATAGVAALAMARPATAAEAFEVDSAHYRLRVTPLATGLVNPWGIAFLPDGDILVTERAGRMRIIRDGRLVAAPLTGVPPVLALGQGGLLDVTAHPQFSRYKYVYFTYSAGSSNNNYTVLARGSLGSGGFTTVKQLFRSAPNGRTNGHFGSRVVHDGRGYLYFTVGDRQEMDRAQRPEETNGKILRLHADGRVPSDNPFVGRAHYRPEIWALGIRSPQGLAFQPGTRRLFECEHGPKGGDEINWIRKGLNYGWPVITHGVDYDGSYIGPPSKPGYEQPVTFWTPSIAPAGISFYDKDLFPIWKNHLLVAVLKGQMLLRLNLGPTGTEVIHEEQMLNGRIGRIRHVKPGPDGKLYLLTDQTDGGVWTVEPVAGAA